MPSGRFGLALPVAKAIANAKRRKQQGESQFSHLSPLGVLQVRPPYKGFWDVQGTARRLCPVVSWS